MRQICQIQVAPCGHIDVMTTGTNIRVAKLEDATLGVTNFGFVNSPASNTEQMPVIAFNNVDNTYMCLWSHDPVTVIIWTTGAVTSGAVTSGLITTSPVTSGIHVKVS